MISQRIGTIIGILLFLSGNFVFAEEKKAPIIAVFDIDDQGAGIKKRILKKLNEYLDAKLTEGGYKVVPRSQIREKLTKKKKESYKECYDQKCQIELGQEVAADKTLSTKILKTGKVCLFTVSQGTENKCFPVRLAPPTGCPLGLS